MTICNECGVDYITVNMRGLNDSDTIKDVFTNDSAYCKQSLQDIFVNVLALTIYSID